MEPFKRGYGLKAAGMLLVIGAIAAALFFGPALQRAPDPGPAADVPAMTNIPPSGSLQLDTEPSDEPAPAR